MANELNPLQPIVPATSLNTDLPIPKKRPIAAWQPDAPSVKFGTQQQTLEDLMKEMGSDSKRPQAPEPAQTGTRGGGFRAKVTQILQRIFGQEGVVPPSPRVMPGIAPDVENRIQAALAAVNANQGQTPGTSPQDVHAAVQNLEKKLAHIRDKVV